MKTQLIVLERPVLISDEDIKPNDWVIRNGYINKALGINPLNPLHKWKEEGWRKIIAGFNLNPLPIIDFSDLPYEIRKKLRIKDPVIIEALHQVYRFLGKKGIFTTPTEEAKILEVLLTQAIIRENEKLEYEQKFGEEEMKKAMELYHEWGLNVDKTIPYNVAKLKHKVIQELSKPKVYDVEVEMNHPHDEPNLNVDLEKRTFELHPKITNNSIKILRIL